MEAVSLNRLLYRIQVRGDNGYLLLKGNWPRKEGEPYDITWPLETTSIAEAQRQADEIIAVDDAKHVPAVANTSHRGEIWHGACEFCGRPALTSGNICRGCDQDIIHKIEDQEAEDGVVCAMYDNTTVEGSSNETAMERTYKVEAQRLVHNNGAQW